MKISKTTTDTVELDVKDLREAVIEYVVRKTKEQFEIEDPDIAVEYNTEGTIKATLIRIKDDY